MRGFKSFNNKVSLELGPGLNCVVGPNGSGKSARGDTQVLLSSGSSCRIKDLVEDALHNSHTKLNLEDGVCTLENPHSIKILSLDPVSMNLVEKEVSAFIKRDGESQLYTIKTKTGRKVTTTGCHPVMIYKNGRIVSEIVQNLKNKQKIAVPNKLNFPEKDIDINLKSINLKKITKRFARFLGYLVGDGCIIANRRIDFVNADKEVLDDYLKIVSGFKYKSYIYQRSNTKAKVVCINSKKFANELVTFFNDKYKKEKKHMPESILFSKKEVLASFLGALFDCDSSFRKEVPTFEYVTMSETLADNVLMSLLRFGIIANKQVKLKCATNTKNKIKKEYYYIYVTGKKDLSKLYQSILFRCKHKNALLYKWANSDAIINSNTNLIPSEVNALIKNCKEVLCISYKPMRKKHPYFAAYLENRCCATREGLIKVISIFEEKRQIFCETKSNIEKNQKKLIYLMRLLNLSMLDAAKYIGISKHAIVDYWAKDKFKARPKNLEKLYLFVKEEINSRLRVSNELIKVLRFLSKSDILWDDIVSIDKVKGEKYVYDLTISDNHNFIGNGIFVHNSNILDSICFVLGRMSTKSIRAENFQDLIHKKKDRHVGSADVVFRLDNTAKIFPIDAKFIEVVRRITGDGKTKYYVNGSRASRRQLVELLSIAKISPEGHNIILQGDIDKFISMSSVEKRHIIEEIAGISIYEMKKQDALRELSKVEEKLKEAKIVLTEKETYLKGLESEKKQAEKYRSFNNEFESTKATGLKLRMNSINKKREEIDFKLGKIEKNQKEFDNQVEEFTKKIDFIRDKIRVVEDKIEKKGGEDQLELEHAISDLKIAVENSNNLILSSKNEINRILQRKKQLEKNLEDISKKLDEKQKEFSLINKEKQDLINKEKTLTNSAASSAKNLDDLDTELDKKTEDIDNLKFIREEISKKTHKFDSDAKLLDYKLEEINQRLSELQDKQEKIKALSRGKDIYKKLIQEINKLSNEDSKLAVKFSDLREKVNIKEELIAKLRIDSKETDDLLMRDRAISQIMSSKKSIGGIIGTVAQLGNSSRQYQQALAVVAGNRMKNIVVDDESTAIKCLNLLKQTKSGIVTMLPMTKIRVRDTSALAREMSNKRGVYGLASDLISCDPKYKPVFKHVFRDTVVVEDTSTAKSLGIGNYNLVTLEGDIFSSSGSITGGFRKQASIKFSEKDIMSKLDAEMSDLFALKRELNRTEKERNDLQEKLLHIRKDKAELEGRIESVDDSKFDPTKIVNEQKDIISQRKQIEAERKKLEQDDNKTQEKIERLTLEKNALASKIKDLRFGKSSTELKQIESRKRDIEAKLATIKAILDNSLLPERDNISKLLSHLEKEQKEFDEQIRAEEKNIIANKKQLDNKQKEEKEFYGSLKVLFTEKKKFADLMEKEEEKLKKLEENKTGDVEERNALSIAKAKIEAEFAAIAEEFEPYKKLKILQHIKSPTQAKQSQEELKRKIESLGTVNMRALEIYESVKKEHDNLIWRVDKLGTEQDSVVGVINQIEHRKKDSFMTTFNGVNQHFQNLFERVSNKMRARLLLEDEQNPFEGGINIIVNDQSGKGMYLGSLSGGEKTLVALAFIFAVQEHNPAPFYLLDEIDAALDKVNSEKVADLLKEYSKKAQVIIISHNDSIISAADNLYGIWMNKNGESFVNSLKI